MTLRSAKSFRSICSCISRFSHPFLNADRIARAILFSSSNSRDLRGHLRFVVSC